MSDAPCKKPEIFHRPELAKKYVDYLLQEELAASGTFLFAPRRTGKTTFLTRDLIPMLEKLGVNLVYVDLWESPHESPENILIKSIKSKIESQKGLKDSSLSMAKRLRLSASGAGINADVDTFSEKDSSSIADALDGYVDERRPLVVIVDEAQQLLTTKKGSDMLFALKAARDRANRPSKEHKILRFLFTGSDRERLASLTNNQTAAFFGAPVLKGTPYLGPDFVQWFCESASDRVKLNVDDVSTLFEDAGYRPEVLIKALVNASLNDQVSDNDRENLFFQLARDDLQLESNVLFDDVLNTSPLTIAVLIALAENSDIAPFSQEAYDAYQEILSDRLKNDQIKATSSSVQTALILLRSKGLICQHSRGLYEINGPEIYLSLESRGLIEASIKNRQDEKSS